MDDDELDMHDAIARQLQGLRSEKHLGAAAKLAGQQLEYLKPAAMAVTSQGVFAGMVTSVPMGTVLIVLANPKRVVTVYMLPQIESLAESVEKCIRYTESQASEHFELSSQTMFTALRVFVNEHGGAPGKETKPVKELALQAMIGLLFAPLPVENRQELFEFVEKVVASGVCPALVGLVGPGINKKAQTYSGAWPLVLPVAQYAELIPD